MMALSVFLERFSRRVCWNLTRHVTAFPRGYSSSQAKASSVREATAVIKENASKDRKSRIFLGTGQYYHHHSNERVVAVSLGDELTMEPPTELLDTVMKSEDIDKLGQKISALPECLSLATGEVDSVHDNPWWFGFTIKPEFAVFSKAGFHVLLKSFPNGHAFRMFDGSLSENVYLNDIQSIQVALSEEPWSMRQVELQLRGNELLTVVEDAREEGSDDLSELMMSTEWLVKMAGVLCLVARQRGGCHDMLLKLPAELRADGNPWIEMRNKAWIDRVHNNDS